ncbi:MAG TPA: TetR/AcrR family transcriptional regulator C-terminal domain-containing protein [Streptosporangiaceae bacterium]|nr:TetR/AcrR family transcriptional regulator C-terminal domain-containing protein [Streptosporangiaceae bacterium]
MVDAAMGTPPAAAGPDEGWRAGLARWAWAERALLRRHPWVLRALFGGLPATPNQIAWLEQGLACLRGTGLAEREKLSVILLVTSYVRMEATLAADVYAAFEASGATAQQAMSAYGRLLAKLTDAKHFPALHAVIEAGVFDSEDDPDDEFIFGIERILDGVGALVRARTTV